MLELSQGTTDGSAAVIDEAAEAVEGAASCSTAIVDTEDGQAAELDDAPPVSGCSVSNASGDDSARSSAATAAVFVAAI